jgi:hypothetical protein
MKYHNKKTMVDNVTFDSIAEANRYVELKMMQKTGKIWGLELQPRFELQGKFVDNKGVKHGAITYVADFLYVEEDQVVVEDVKGMQTPVYKLKKKIFLYTYNHDFREIS